MKATRRLFAVAFFSAWGAAFSAEAAALPTVWNTANPKDGAWIQDFDPETPEEDAPDGFTGGNAAFFATTNSKGRLVTAGSAYEGTWQDAATAFACDAVYVQFAMQNVVYVGDDPTDVNKPFFSVEEGDGGARSLVAKYYTGEAIATLGDPIALPASILDDAWFTVTVKVTGTTMLATISDFANAVTIPLPPGAALPRSIKVFGEGAIDNLLASYGDPLRTPLYTAPPGCSGEGGVTLDPAVQTYAEAALQSCVGATSVALSTQNGSVTLSTAQNALAVHETAYLLGADFTPDGDAAKFTYELGIDSVTYAAGSITAKVKLTINGTAKQGAINGQLAVYLGTEETPGATLNKATFENGIATLTVPYTLQGTSSATLTAKIIPAATEP